MKEIIILGLEIIFLISIPITFLVLAHEEQNKKDCGYFKNYEAQDLPARCIEYYNK